jgi:hypothetical protein
MTSARDRVVEVSRTELPCAYQIRFIVDKFMRNIVVTCAEKSWFDIAIKMSVVQSGRTEILLP